MLYPAYSEEWKCTETSAETQQKTKRSSSRAQMQDITPTSHCLI